ncbi:MAG TPA: radical SAM protein [Terracidiphilus sp.]|jgi:MoaA/NifB/PqqE/SkfB family radical SAM enzyme|nr:radical SAM protein [Terracidiphilus sp.]
MLSIEVTRECPLRCPGCYAYGDNHLGGEVTLRELSDKRGDDLVGGVLALMDRHKPLHVTLVGGEPMVRHRELSRILPEVSRRGIHSMVVTSGIIPIPLEWMTLPNFRAAVSIDGLPEHHDVRRHPATYERILTNLKDRQVNVHWTITAQMLEREDYLEEYVRFWNARPEVCHIWVSIYSPQRGEQSAELLSAEQRALVARELPRLRKLYPKLLTPHGYAEALLHPPSSPEKCTFSRLSKNYSADLKTHVEPCVFGGDPDCSQCGCSASVAAHWVSGIKVAGPLKARHLLRGSMRIGSAMARLQRVAIPAWRQRGKTAPAREQDLVQITMD